MLCRVPPASMNLGQILGSFKTRDILRRLIRATEDGMQPSASRKHCYLDIAKETVRMIVTKRRGNAVFGRKADQVLNGAWRIFLRDGYAGAAVDDIVRSAGVSKATLYAYFPDKRLLFETAIQNALEEDRTHPLADIGKDLPAERAVPRITAAITAWLRSDRETDLFRVVISESNRFPDMAATYHERIGTLLEHPLREHLDRFVARGELSVDDMALAARQLIGLCGLAVHDRATAGTALETEMPVRRTAEAAATMFLRAYGTGIVRQPRQRDGWENGVLSSR